jgi:succinate-acetate transporter protein
MITIFLIIWAVFKFTFWFMKLCLYIIFLPFILPFKLLGGGKKKEKKPRDYDDGFWDGFWIGSFWDD